MTKILTLIDAERSPRLVPLVDRCKALLGVNARWLSLGHAVEFAVDDVPSTLFALIKDAGLAKIDLAVTPAEKRRKSLLISDMDSTIIDNECIDEIAAMAGIGDQVAAITERAMRGDLDFKEALDERVALLEGLSVRLIDTIIKERITVRPGARRLVATMREAGAFTALVSGGFIDFTSHIRRTVGFDMDHANQLEMIDGVLTGRVIPPVLGPQAKRETLLRLCKRHNLEPDDVIAVGDGANDIEMISLAGLGVGFHAHQKVQDMADVNIRHNDLTALLYVQGFTASEMVRD